MSLVEYFLVAKQTAQSWYGLVDPGQWDLVIQSEGRHAAGDEWLRVILNISHPFFV
jgi:hypothetical protein